VLLSETVTMQDKYLVLLKNQKSPKVAPLQRFQNSAGVLINK
jgi:hypothetical protein